MTISKYQTCVLSIALAVQPCFASSAQSPVVFPVFLKSGFSSVIEFDESPTRVVIGDSQYFQVERLDRSLVLRTLAPFATTNLFVYFREAAPRLFVLTASEDAEPTFFKKIEEPKKVIPSNSPAGVRSPSNRTPSRVTSAIYDKKKDYLTIEVVFSADSKAALRPKWELVRLRLQNQTVAPIKLWSERSEIQKDSAIRARFIFAKPNLPRDLADARLVVPIEGNATALSLQLKGVKR